MTKHIQRIRGKYSNVHGEINNFGLFALYKVISRMIRQCLSLFGEYAESIQAHIENTKNLAVFS
jgi:hypothetical protein